MGRGVDRRKLAAWRRRLARQEASGLTVAAFCRQERVSVSLWKHWQREATVVSVAPPVRPDVWKESHPEAVRVYRAEERAARADAKFTKRAHRRAGPKEPGIE